MPRADATLETEAPAPAVAPVRSARVCGWGGGAGVPVTVVRPARVDQFASALEWCCASGRAGAGAIARGMGRSYGDAAQLNGGLVLDTNRLKRFELDAEHGTVTAEAGVTIAELLDAGVPAGWMVPVVPGTQHVSVGGAIASDIHGKNHGAAGTFGSHVDALGLLTAGGEVLELGPENPRVRRHPGRHGADRRDPVGADPRCWRSAARGCRSTPTGSTRSTTRSRRYGRPGGPHRVAWLDLLGPRPGRGVVTRAEHLRRRRGSVGARGIRDRRGARDRYRRAGPAGCCGPRPSARSTSFASGARPGAPAAWSRASARTCSRSTRSAHGRGSTARRASSSTSWSSRTEPSASSRT